MKYNLGWKQPPKDKTSEILAGLFIVVVVIFMAAFAASRYHVNI